MWQPELVLQPLLLRALLHRHTHTHTPKESSSQSSAADGLYCSQSVWMYVYVCVCVCVCLCSRLQRPGQKGPHMHMHMKEEGRGGGRWAGGFEGSLLNPMWCTFLVKLIDIIICMRSVCANSTHTLAMNAHVFYGVGGGLIHPHRFC